MPDRMPDRLTVNLHYGRTGRAPSSRKRRNVAFAWIAASLALALGQAHAQYPGQVKKDKDAAAPSLRAVGVLEWTGDLSKPKTSRLVPITVFDGQELQDAGVYLARPQPLAVEGGVEYILQKNGARLGLFEVQSAAQQQDAWVGFGVWKPMPSLKPKASEAAPKIDEPDSSDRPTLHRKKGSDDSSSSGAGSGTGTGSGSGAPDPDRPTLHKKSSSDAGHDKDDGAATSSSAPDPDRPTLHKAPDGGSGSETESSSSSAADPDRPTLKRGKAKQSADQGYVESLPNATDPDRPRLQRGKSTGGVASEVTPTLIGMPSDMTQAVAVSDPRNRPEHPWNYTWADPADELKMKAALEDIARTALGLQSATPAKPAVRRAGSTKVRAKPGTSPDPPALVDEEFRVFELAYGSGATLVLTARNDAPPAQQKFVTLIAQPDLYGSLLVLFKSVTDGAHLDDTPRMRLVDAVDALADNRGELVFELRGSAQRQFALYRVLRGRATQLFVTGGGAIEVSGGY